MKTFVLTKFREQMLNLIGPKNVLLIKILKDNVLPKLGKTNFAKKSATKFLRAKAKHFDGDIPGSYHSVLSQCLTDSMWISSCLAYNLPLSLH